jgi:ATPase subunit of ABC transporter with duplicated ATPase domains
MKVEFKKDYIIETTYDQSPMRKGTFTKTKVEELEGRELDNLRREKERKLESEGERFFCGRRANLTKKEISKSITREYKKLFNKGSVFESNGGVNVLVGDNGCGKSSLIGYIVREVEGLKYLFIDLEQSNPKVSSPAPKSGVSYSIGEISNKFMWSVESHGETREGVLKSILSLDFSETELLILDEPEQGLSLKNQAKYFKALEDMDTEVILITHSKMFIELTDKVFDVETMKWIDSEKYLSDILK